MLRHFQLTLSTTSDELFLLSLFLEHSHDLIIDQGTPMPEPLRIRLRKTMAPKDPETQFAQLLNGGHPNWDIGLVTDDSVTLATSGNGENLTSLLALIEILAPGILDRPILYRPCKGSRFSPRPATAH